MMLLTPPRRSAFQARHRRRDQGRRRSVDGDASVHNRATAPAGWWSMALSLASAGLMRQSSTNGTIESGDGFERALATCLSLDALCVPSLMVASAWLEHAPFGSWLVAAQKPRQIVELGTHRGFSYSVFCETVARHRIWAKCIAVDTWKGDEHAGFYDEMVFNGLRDYNQHRFGSFSRLLRSTFDNAVKEFPDGSIDLLHIDGRHRYEDVKHDFLTWKPKLSDRGVVLFHDTTEKRDDFGVYRFWDELKPSHPHFEFWHGHGLGVLAVGNRIAAPLQTLFDAQPRAADLVRGVYTRLGEAVTVRSELATANEKVRRLESARAPNSLLYHR
jgi:hypothetical protein